MDGGTLVRGWKKGKHLQYVDFDLIAGLPGDLKAKTEIWLDWKMDPSRLLGVFLLFERGIPSRVFDTNR